MKIIWINSYITGRLNLRWEITSACTGWPMISYSELGHAKQENSSIIHIGQAIGLIFILDIQCIHHGLDTVNNYIASPKINATWKVYQLSRTGRTLVEYYFERTMPRAVWYSFRAHLQVGSGFTPKLQDWDLRVEFSNLEGATGSTTMMRQSSRKVRILPLHQSSP